MKEEHLRNAIKFAGNQAALAALISKKTGDDIQQGHISFWLNKSKKGIPPKYALAVEEITGIPKESLCPEAYPAGRSVKATEPTCQGEAA